MTPSKDAVEEIRKKLKDCIPDDECNYHLRDSHWIPDIIGVIADEHQKTTEKFKEEIDERIILLKEAENYAPKRIKENVRVASQNCIYVLEELKQSLAKFGVEK